MRRTVRRWGIVLVVMSAVSVVPLAYGVHGTPPEASTAGQIGAGEVALDEAVLVNPQQVRAFIPTGSKSHRCLVTYSESTIAGLPGSPYCGARTVDGIDGLLITIFLAEPVSDLFLSMTVYQQFAKQYGSAELYSGD